MVLHFCVYVIRHVSPDLEVFFVTDETRCRAFDVTHLFEIAQ